jgi:NAD(P)-dependent dehydrogenase (short-subunit alcohol dehydrogenase family)
MNLEGKKILVTGVASGIGAAAAHVLAKYGARVVGLDRIERESSIGLSAFHKIDLADPESIDRVVAEIGGDIDGIANIAGVSSAVPSDLLFKINYLGPRHLVGRAVPFLNKSASIVSVASGTGVRWRERLSLFKGLAAATEFADGLAWLAQNSQDGVQCYARSKEALIIWTQLKAAEFAGSGVRFNTVSPGPVETPMLREFRGSVGDAIIDSDIARSGRAGTPDDIAPIIAFLMSGDSAWVNGADIPVDGGFSASVLTASTTWSFGV